jgi:anti-anti-sigma factor
MLTLRSRTFGDAVVLDLEGDLVHDERVPKHAARAETFGMVGANARSTVRQEVGRLARAGHRRILLNLDRVRYIDSLGLGELIASKKEAMLAGAQLGLVRPNSKVQSVLAATMLGRLFQCFEDEAVALETFGT